MFSEQYKKDNEKLTLSDDFLDQLKVKMRQEQERQKENPSKKDLSDEVTIDFTKEPNDFRWKRTLPIALTACAALVVVVAAPSLLSQSRKGDCSYNKEYSAATESYDINETKSAQQEPSYEAKTEEAKAYDSLAPAEAESKEELASGAGTFDKSDKLTFNISNAAEDGADDESAASYGITNQDEMRDNLQDNGGMSVNLPDSDGYVAPLDLTFEEATFNFKETKNFAPSIPSQLEETMDLFVSQSQGADMVNLDYAANGRVIAHDYYGLMIYDYNADTLLRLVDLRSRINNYTTGGDTTLDVMVCQGGNYLILDSNMLSSTNHMCYLYDVQTDTMISLNSQQLSHLDFPSIDGNLSYEDNDTLDSVLSYEYRSAAAAEISPTEKGFLYYQSTDDTSVASLSLCIVAMNEKGDKTNVRTLPLFGEDTIADLKEEGHHVDRIVP